jgi:hypothetical protein
MIFPGQRDAAHVKNVEWIMKTDDLARTAEQPV